MIGLEIRSNLTRMERSLAILAHKQMPFATARALNDVARVARDRVNADMPEIFDRPTDFTRRAVVAPRELAAQKDRLAATVTLRPVQAKYLLREELGGARTPADNTRRTGASAIVLPGRALLLDAHGNIPGGELRHLRRLAKAGKLSRRGKHVAPPEAGAVAFLAADAPGNKAGIGGYFQRAGRSLRRLTAFKPETAYRPRFDYHKRVTAAVAPRWAAALVKRLHEAIATAK